MDSNETNAMRKLLREPFAYSGPKSPGLARALRLRAEETTDADEKAAFAKRAEELEAERIEGEIWPLTFRERCSVDLMLAEAAAVADEEGSSPRIKNAYLGATTVRLHARACLRVAGTKGKVHVLTHNEAQSLDVEAATDIYGKFVEAFVLTENESPKGPTLRS
jgi:hypothetical protein